MRKIDYETLKNGDAVITRDGRKGRVICVDAETKGISGWQPIVCLIPGENDGEEAKHYCKDGSFIEGETAGHDIFLPPKKEYINVLHRVDGFALSSITWSNRKDAENFGSGQSEYHKTIEVEV